MDSTSVLFVKRSKTVSLKTKMGTFVSPESMAGTRWTGLAVNTRGVVVRPGGSTFDLCIVTVRS
jgi:hypothetical protein